MTQAIKEFARSNQLPESQFIQLNDGLDVILNQYRQANIDDLNSSEFGDQILTQLERLMQRVGLAEDNIEPLIEVLYYENKTKNFAEFVVITGRTAYESSEWVEHIYELMMEELMNDRES
jgi:ribosome assembly protein YihI (activator of Der GTPase)